jgi:hypothetical protein
LISSAAIVVVIDYPYVLPHCIPPGSVNLVNTLETHLYALPHGIPPISHMVLYGNRSVPNGLSRITILSFGIPDDNKEDGRRSIIQ